MSWLFFNEEIENEWDRFVEEQEDSRFIHLIGFKRVIERVYKFEPFYLYFKKGNEIFAVFSSFIQNSILTGRKIVSQPFSEYGGLVFSKFIKNEEKIEILDELFSILKDTLRKKNIKGLEIRGRTDPLAEKYAKKIVLGNYGIKRLEKNMDIWKSVDYMVRKAVNKAKREGVIIFEDLNFDRIRDFYSLHLRTMKRFGSPPHPYTYFINLKKELSQNIKIYYAVYREKIIAFLLGWKVGKSIHITDNPSDRRFFPLRGNDYLHFIFLQGAKENGCNIFDFGPMRYEGQEFFKKKWNLETHEYSIFHYPPVIKTLAYKPPFYVKIASKIWKLVPTKFSRYMGKFLRKELGL